MRELEFVSSGSTIASPTAYAHTSGVVAENNVQK